MGLTELEDKITGSIDKLSESVVTIRSTRIMRQFPFGNAPINGSGSGFIIDSNGYIASNYHVVNGASKVEVVLKDGSAFAGNVIGGDKATDVVLIKIEGGNLPSARLGDSERLKVGQLALAIGNSLDLPGGPTISLGVVSALGRPLPWANFIFEGLIQTDAAINPGNSGGPLADSDGNVIGMNTAMVPFAQGVGFAIPINTIKWVLEQIINKGRVVRPSLGVSVLGLTPALSRRFRLPVDSGVLLENVSPNSPAHKSGLQPGDIVESIGGFDVNTIKGLLLALSKLPVGEGINLKFVREGKRREVRIRLEERRIEN